MSKLSKAPLPKEVKDYIASCREVLAYVESAMQDPSTFQRGEKIGRAMHKLAWHTDYIEHFGIKGWPCKRPSIPGKQ